MGFILKITLTGLIALVPHTDGNQMMALLLDARQPRPVSDGKTVVTHAPMLRYRVSHLSLPCRDDDPKTKCPQRPDVWFRLANQSVGHFPEMEPLEEVALLRRVDLTYSSPCANFFRSLDCDGYEPSQATLTDHNNSCILKNLKSLPIPLQSIPRKNYQEFGTVLNLNATPMGSKGGLPEIKPGCFGKIPEGDCEGLVVARVLINNGLVQAGPLSSSPHGAVREWFFEPLTDRTGKRRTGPFVFAGSVEVLVHYPKAISVFFSSRNFTGNTSTEILELFPTSGTKIGGLDSIEVVIENVPVLDILQDKIEMVAGPIRHAEWLWELFKYPPPWNLRPVPSVFRDGPGTSEGNPSRCEPIERFNSSSFKWN